MLLLLQLENCLINKESAVMKKKQLFTEEKLQKKRFKLENVQSVFITEKI